jgi:hypothetical protein
MVVGEFLKRLDDRMKSDEFLEDSFESSERNQGLTLGGL